MGQSQYVQVEANMVYGRLTYVKETMQCERPILSPPKLCMELSVCFISKSHDSHSFFWEQVCTDEWTGQLGSYYSSVESKQMVPSLWSFFSSVSLRRHMLRYSFCHIQCRHPLCVLFLGQRLWVVASSSYFKFIVQLFVQTIRITGSSNQ